MNSNNPRPKQIMFFLYTFIGGIVVSFLDFALQIMGLSVQNSEFMTFGSFVLGGLIHMVFVWFIFKGKNWSRIIFSILTLAGIPYGIYIVSVEISGDILGGISSIIQIVLALSSVYFLFTKPSNRWFKDTKRLKSV